MSGKTLVTAYFFVLSLLIFGFTPNAVLSQVTSIHADDVLGQTMFAKNESGYEWIIGLQLNRKDVFFKGKITGVVYEIVVKNEGREIDRTNLFTLDFGDYKLENANGHFTSSQLYKLKYTATAYYEKLDFKLAFREIHFETGEIARFDSNGNYLK